MGPGQEGNPMSKPKKIAAKQAATDETPAPEAATTKKTKAPAKPKATADTTMSNVYCFPPLDSLAIPGGAAEHSAAS
jgi:hypothetical protein